MGSSDNAKRLRHTYASEGEALEEASAELTRLQRKHAELTLDLSKAAPISTPKPRSPP